MHKESGWSRGSNVAGSDMITDVGLQRATAQSRWM
jgi:hypothetical protein